MRCGYLSPPVLIILAVITLAVAFVIYFNTNLIKQSKNQPTPPSGQIPSDVVAGPKECLRADLNRTNNPPINEDLKNWKTFRNEEFGFQMKHPEEWSISDPIPDRNSISTISFVNKNAGGGGASTWLDLMKETKETASATLIKPGPGSHGAKGKIYSSEELTLYGEPAQKLIYSNPEGANKRYALIFEKNGTAFIFYEHPLYRCIDQGYQSLEDEFAESLEKIFLSFKFLD